MTIIAQAADTAWTYTVLKSKIAGFLHRSDLTTSIPDFIALAEDDMNSELRLRVMEVDEDVTLADGARTINLPDGYIEPISLKVTFDGRDDEDVIYMQPQDLVINESSGVQCQPDFWSIDGTTIIFPNQADQDYTMRFRMLKRLDIATTNTNRLLADWRGLYLFGALKQAAMYLVNDKRVIMWEREYERLKTRVKIKEGRAKSLAKLRTEAAQQSRYTNILKG